MKTVHQILFGVVASTVLAACGGGTPDITGRWVSEEVETRAGAGDSKLYLRRDFTTKATTSAAQFDFFEDVEGTKPTVSVWLNGPYTLSEPWEKVEGSYAGEFVFEELKITPKSAAFVDLLNGSMPGTCGTKAWELNVEQDLSGTVGCLTLGLDLKNRNTEYDIVKLDGDKLYYGARPTDGTGLDSPDKRPTALQVPLLRAE
jgi:hypothetical protein